MFDNQIIPPTEGFNTPQTSSIAPAQALNQPRDGAVLEQNQPGAGPVLAQNQPTVRPVLTQNQPGAGPVLAQNQPSVRPVLTQNQPGAGPVLTQSQLGVGPVSPSKQFVVRPVPSQPRPNLDTLQNIDDQYLYQFPAAFSPRESYAPVKFPYGSPIDVQYRKTLHKTLYY